MANKKKFYGKRMVPEYLITKLETLEPGGGEYTAGNGIDIEDNEISIDDTVVATKTDLEDYELKSEAFSGSYTDLTDKPTIPTDTSDLTNGAGFITGIDSSMVITALGYTPGTSNFSGNYNDLSNKPTIPTVTNSITQGSTDAVTSGAVYSAIGDIESLLAAI